MFHVSIAKALIPRPVPCVYHGQPTGVVVGARNRTNPISCSESIPESIPLLKSIPILDPNLEPILELTPEPIPRPGNRSRNGIRIDSRISAGMRISS